MLESGIYEQVVNKKIHNELALYSEQKKYLQSIDEAEAPRVFAQYISEIIEKALTSVADSGGSLANQVHLVNQILQLIISQTKRDEFNEFSVSEEGSQLLALINANDYHLPADAQAKLLQRPLTPLSVTSLFTGMKKEPPLFSELNKEIRSADQVDILVSFIKISGLRLIMDELRHYTNSGKRLRIITTTYIGATDPKAIFQLSQLPNTEIKISYDTKGTRLHAKSYIFHRKTGFTTAYVGSSNMSGAALDNGLEWNIKASAKDVPDTIAKISATFESYWAKSSFELFEETQKPKLLKSIQQEKSGKSLHFMQALYDVYPYAFQQEILDRLQAEREIRGRFKNLIVAATGTGKTMISAFDYKNFVRQNPNKENRLLFVAHREEILLQSIGTFRQVMRNQNFADLHVGNYRMEHKEHLFISIQSYNSSPLDEELPEDYYDYIVIDEFHHAAAPSYQTLLTHFKPKVLIGLTATPERMDGKSILDYFDGRIAAEIRLPEAIERGLLCPFQYFGVSDNTDLDKLSWTRGGYDKGQLSNLYTIDQIYAKQRLKIIFESLDRYINDVNEVKALGFCVTIEHAKFMADAFNENGVPSLALTGLSPDEERKTARSRLQSGELKFIFVVDIFNEGVDIPEVNTVLFLRPTESLTIFLQQLGRGLRTSNNKDCLTVLDFVGQSNKRYRFEEKFSALLSNNRHSVQHELEHGFISMPKGCYVHLEKRAKDIILNNIKSSYSTRRGILARLITFEEDTEQTLTLGNFLDYYHLDIKTLYSRGSFSSLKVEAGLSDTVNEPLCSIFPTVLKRFASIDSRRWIHFLLRILPQLAEIDLMKLCFSEQRMFRMFYITVWQGSIPELNSEEMQTRMLELRESPTCLFELEELLKYQLDKIDFIDAEIDLGFACPLDLHCSYTRDQLFTAFDVANPHNIREGTKWIADKSLDVFLVTLNKSDKDYSPSTMYKDYSISNELFHWQSQSTTSDSSPTGMRYINHHKEGSKVLLFVRDYKSDSAGAQAYTFLGTATYISHEGSRPMSIIWRLDRPIPAKFIKKTAKLDVA